MSEFSYDRIDLSTDAIRLLLLSKGYHTDPIRCQLFEAFPRAEEGVPYEALSYTWGDAADRVPITINDRTLHVTSNLYNALHCLRSDAEDRVLWVDAICIDQGHHLERNHQVGQMKLIYENAKNVVIWLGPGSQEIEILFDMIGQLDKRGGRDPRRTSIDAWTVHWSAILKETGGVTAPFYDIRRQALKGLLARAWFERVWVIQEAWSARRAVVVCGWQSVAARAFALMPSLMSIDAGSRPQALLEAMPGPLRAEKWQERGRDLKTLLQMFCDSKATDERDQVYALLGISSDAAENDALLPRYDLPLSTTLRDTVSFLVFGTVLEDSFRFPFWTLDELRLYLGRLPEELFSWSLQCRSDNLASRLVSDGCIDTATATLNGGPPLHYLAESKGALSVASLLLASKGVDVNQTYCGRPLLHEAVRARHTALIQLLCEQEGLVRSARDEESLTALERAVQEGSHDIVKLLLADRGLDPWAVTESPFPPLTIAAEKNDVEILTTLMYAGALIESHNKRGCTALWEAASHGHMEVVRTLLDKGANPRAKHLGQQRTAFFMAAMNGHVDMVRLLAAVSTSPPYDEELSDLVDGSALWEAVGQQRFEMARMLLDMGANPRVVGYWGRTALSMAANNGDTEIVRLLIEHGAHLREPGSETSPGEAQLEVVNATGCTALWEAADHGHAEVVGMLLEKGANVEAKSPVNKRTVLFAALTKGHVSVVRLLVEAGARVNEPADASSTIGLMTALGFAACQGPNEIVRILLEHGAEVDCRPDGICPTPLWFAAQAGRAESVRHLLAHGADIEATDAEHHGSPLWIAAWNGWLSVVKLLVKGGANLEARGDGPSKRTKGTTPLLIALMPKRDENHEQYASIVRFLVMNGADVDAKNDSRMPASAYIKSSMPPDVRELLSMRWSGRKRKLET
ncbi:hypothetical protein ACHAQA_000823 [Verticillium albo-atrum]